jgi:ribosomal protein L17
LAVAFKAYRRNPGTHAENEARAAQYLAEHLINEEVIETIEEKEEDVQKFAENVINPPQEAQEETQADSQNEAPRQIIETPFTVEKTQPNRTSYSPVEKDYLGS